MTFLPTCDKSVLEQAQMLLSPQFKNMLEEQVFQEFEEAFVPSPELTRQSSDIGAQPFSQKPFTKASTAQERENPLQKRAFVRIHIRAKGAYKPRPT